MLKRCNTCGRRKSVEQFTKVKKWRRGDCNSCRRKDSANRALKQAYGIDTATKKRMYMNQRGLCGACGLPLSKNYRKAHVDHDHRTGQIRELLHAACNWLMGQEEAQPNILKKILVYRKKWLDNSEEVC